MFISSHHNAEELTEPARGKHKGGRQIQIGLQDLQVGDRFYAVEIAALLMHFRIRRVKCGEEKPHCLRCTSTGRKCEYQGTKPGLVASAPWKVIVADKPISSLPATVWRERRAFAYYFERAASLVGGELDVEFWRIIVPQICRSEPAVWDAINSISVLFENPNFGAGHEMPRNQNGSTLSQNHRDALSWYSRSVSAVRQRIERGDVDVFVGLVSCVLFICIEALQGGVEEALQLYCQGVHLIIALRNQIASGLMLATKASLLENTIVPIFMRMGALALSISNVPVSILLHDAEHISTPEFTSLKAAREAIVPLATEIQILQGTCEQHSFQSRISDEPQELINQRDTLSISLSNWRTSFMSMMQRLRTKGDLSAQQIGMGARLLAYYEMLFVLLGTCISPLQMITDKYLSHFQSLVEQSSIAIDTASESDGTKVPFTFELSIGLPLWFTCLRCRDPTIRRVALALLRRGPRVQGFYTMTPATILCEAIMMLEETHAMSRRTDQEETMCMTSESMEGCDKHKDVWSAIFNAGPRAQTAAQIPEEARCGPIVIIRSGGKIPLGMSESVFAHLNQIPGQSFLQFSRNECDPISGTWQRVYDYIPLGIDI